MECYTYCTAASYQMKQIYQCLKSKYHMDKQKEFLHLSIGENDEQKDIFIFAYGALVTWGVSREEFDQILSEIKPYQNESEDTIEMERYDYHIGEKISFKDDKITLTDNEPLSKLAFSYGLAQSIKLAAFEMSIQNTFTKTKHLPEHLAKAGNIPLSRKQMRRKIGTIFLQRSSINLHLDVLDTPDFFWEYPQYEKIYKLMRYELDLEDRTNSLNQQLNVLHEMFEMLANELNHQHSSRLEWAIILLIVIEVVFMLFHDIIEII